MQFNSYLFVMLFLPFFVLGYFISNKKSELAGKVFIIAAGILFYIYGGWDVTRVFGISIAINLIFSVIIKRSRHNKRIFAAVAILLNIILLLFYKYFNFAVVNINKIFLQDFHTKELILPIGISFFTFQQIMYIVAVYKNEIEKVDAVDYLSYILFFPKLVMGPLIEAKDFINQLNDTMLKRVDWDNIASGLKLFSFGLFKKMVLADTFSKGVAWGFANIEAATSGDFWLVMLFYTFEIYFDFSGYTDMAIGVSAMINISLPMNFNSPYKAFSIRDFWKRWHISLTNFFTKYIYFPLGGGKKGKIRTYINIMIVFLLSGLWHGANWTFILWGCLHGILQVIERIFKNSYDKLFVVVKWWYTFLAVNLLWLLFRAETITQWLQLIKKMLTFSNMAISEGLKDSFALPENTFFFDILKLMKLNAGISGFSMLFFIAAAFLICLLPDNNYKNMKRTGIINMIFCAIALVWGILCLSSESVFVYFNF